MLRRAKICSRLIPLIVVLAALLISMSPRAQVPRQEEVLRIGSTDLRIGMSKDKVLSMLETDGFTHDPGQISYNIEAISVMRYPENELVKAFATLFFENKKLIRVKRMLDFRTEVEALETIYSLVAKFQEEGNRVCHLTARSIEDGDHTHKSAIFACGHKFIEISIWQGSGGKALLVGIDEVLSESLLP